MRFGLIALLSALVLSPAALPVRAADPTDILVVGGTRATGLEIVKLLRSEGQTVTVMARHSSDVSALEKLGVPVVRADALKAAEVARAIEPGRYRAVISTLGVRTRSPRDRITKAIGMSSMPRRWPASSASSW